MLTKEEIRTARKEIATDDEQLPFIFNALSDMGRYRIFKLLLQRHDLCVTDVANVLGISLPAASQQLHIMELSGLVKKERMGQMMCYCIREEDPVVKSVIKMINHS